MQDRAGPPAGWLIGVVIEDEDGTARRYFAVARPDQARAEWAAVDLALQAGRVATSPVGGLEPVQAIAPLSAATLARNGVSGGAVKALGPRWPRRWLPA